MAESAPVTTYVKGGKRRHPASYRKPPHKTVFKKSRSTTGGTKHSGSISTSSGGA